MKTAGRENPNRRTAVSSTRVHGAAAQSRSRSIRWAGKQEKLRPQEECFFLTSTFIELRPQEECFFLTSTFIELRPQEECFFFASTFIEPLGTWRQSTVLHVWVYSPVAIANQKRSIPRAQPG